MQIYPQSTGNTAKIDSLTFTTCLSFYELMSVTHNLPTKSRKEDMSAEGLTLKQPTFPGMNINIQS